MFSEHNTPSDALRPIVKLLIYPIIRSATVVCLTNRTNRDLSRSQASSGRLALQFGLAQCSSNPNQLSSRGRRVEAVKQAGKQDVLVLGHHK